MTAPADLPLPVLLSRVLGRLTVEVEAAAGVGPDVPSLAVWSNVLRCVGDGISERALPEAARISSRLATAAVTGSSRRGWIRKEPQVELTDAGRSAAERWPAQLAELDSAWKGTPLRAALDSVVGQLELELPHYPASYGAADPSAIGAPFMGPPKGDEARLRHGKDWRPVLRGDGDTVTSLPITALLSQALMAFTIDYENGFPWPLASTLTVLCHLDVEPRPLADVPGDHGIKGNGKSLLERHLIVDVTPDPGGARRKLVALTDRGAAVMKHHPGRLETVESEWCDRFGEGLIADLRDSLGAVDPWGDPSPDHVLGPLHNG